MSRKTKCRAHNGRSVARKSPRRARAVEEEQAPYGEKLPDTPFRFLEFFAGGGMARAGLSPRWVPVWANDFSPEKAEAYRDNWGANELHVGDVAKVAPSELPDAEMAWGSFPCQDLSAAGGQEGIGSADESVRTRSGTFWPFWTLVQQKRPPLVVLENVEGALTSNAGRDIEAICLALSGAGYRFGPIVIDAVHWVPQSRRRLFIVAVDGHFVLPEMFTQPVPDIRWHTSAVCDAYRSIDPNTRKSWVWWQLPAPDQSVPRVALLIDPEPKQWVTWDSAEKTNHILGLMSPINQRKLEAAKMLVHRVIGFGYRRTRQGAQRLELRFDGIAGCLRTAAGGSSKQIVVEVVGKRVRTRLLSPREAARLQGLPDSYQLPENYNAAYDLVGDGLCVPVVRFLGQSLLTPLATVFRHAVIHAYENLHRVRA